MIKLTNPRNYALIVGSILFILGILGFAFRSSSNTPDYMLALAILVGFWGIYSGNKK
jgi:hypothetical protein